MKHLPLLACASAFLSAASLPAAAEALGRFGSEADLGRVLPLLATHADWAKSDVFTVMAALNALSALGEKAAPLAATIKALPDQGPVSDGRYKEYVPRLLEELRASLR